MEVDVSRHKEIYDKDSMRKFGRAWPVGMSIIPIAMWFFIFFMGLIISGVIPGSLSIKNPDLTWDMIVFYSLFIFITSMTAYLTYDVYGNYLYYKGKWSDPPFAKRSVKRFWKDMKRGKMPGLVLPEIPEGEEVLVFHLIYQTLGNRGVVVKISKEEKLRMDKQIKELKEKGAQNIEFIYRGNRIEGARVYYGNGRIEEIDKETAETMRFLYVLGKNNHTIMRSIRIMRDLVKE